LDGEWYSNTLGLERDFGWNGLLIEADPSNFKALLERNRKSLMVPACLSMKNTPQLVRIFLKALSIKKNVSVQVAFAKNTFSLGKIASVKDAKAGKSDTKFFDIQCMPLTAILLAVNMTEIDFFSLDIEGHELDVLRAIDFDKIKIKAKPRFICIV
jgi:hypothetical protein